jgi:hypothetical protein
MISYGSEYPFVSAEIGTFVDAAKIDSTHFVAVYRLGSDFYPYCVIGTISNDNQISYGSLYQVNIEYGAYDSIDVLDSTHFVLAARQSSVAGQAVVGVISSVNQIAYGSIVNFWTGDTDDLDLVTLDSTHFVVIWNKNGTPNYNGESIVGVVSGGNTITFGSVYEVIASQSANGSLCKIDSTHFIVAYYDPSAQGSSKVGTVTEDNKIAYGSAYAFDSDAPRWINMAMLDSSHFVLVFSEDSTRGTARIGTIASVNQLSYGAEYVYSNTGVSSDTYDSVGVIDSTHFIVSYCNAADAKGTTKSGTISNTTEIAFGDAYIFNNASTAAAKLAMLDSIHFVIAYRDQGNGNYGTAIIGAYSSDSTGNFLAFF